MGLLSKASLVALGILALASVHCALTPEESRHPMEASADFPPPAPPPPPPMMPAPHPPPPPPPAPVAIERPEPLTGAPAPEEGLQSTPLNRLEELRRESAEEILRRDTLDNLAARVSASKQIELPHGSGELRIWIGSLQLLPETPESFVTSTVSLPRGQSAKVSPFAPDFYIEPPEASICVAVVEHGSFIRFALKPKRSGDYEVGADVQLYKSTDCSGAPVQKPTDSVRVRVVVHKAEAFLEKASQLFSAFWKELSAALIAMLVAGIIAMIRKKSSK